MTSTASAILVLFDSTAFAANVFTFGLEITCMTGSAIDCISLRGSIRRTGVWEVSVYGCTMTASAARIASVISGVAPIWTMAEVGWCPAIGRMTHVALYSRA